MKKKLLLFLLLLSSSIKSINADFKHMLEGNIFSQLQKKQNIRGKRSDTTSKFLLGKGSKLIESKETKNLGPLVVRRDNSIQKPLQSPNPFFSIFNKQITKTLFNNNSRFVSFLKKISAPLSLSKLNTTMAIKTAIKTATPKSISNAEVLEVLPKVTNAPKVVTIDNTTNSIAISEAQPVPNLTRVSVDAPVLKSPTTDSTPQNAMASETISTLLEINSPTLEPITVVKSNAVNSISNDIIRKVDKEALRPDLTAQRLNLLKEIKERAGKPKPLPVSKTTIKNINQVQEKLKNTVTGSLLDHNNPSGKTLENALSFKVKKMLTKIARDEKSKNKIASPSILQALKDDRRGIEKEVTDLCRDVLIKSAEYSDDYYTFYHGHGNGLRLYFDILREIKSFENIRTLDSGNPLRDKPMESIGNTVEEILSNFEDKALDYATRNNQKLYDLNRGMGVGFAPDKIEYFRDHVISVNPNLFGNMNNLAECTLFYWLDSFNISNPNEILVKNLLMRIATHLPEEKITERMTQYTALYNDFMKETGGNLMQIHVHKSIVDEISYASWMKGIPVLLDKETHKLATRGGNSKPVPVLTDRDNAYERPKTSDYLDLLTQDPDQFIKQYSDFSNRTVIKKHDLEECLDRPQARIVVNPSYFNNPDLVKVNHYTRFKASEDGLAHYQQKLKGLIQEDMDAYLKQLQTGGVKGQSGDPLTKLTKYIEEGTEFDFNVERIKVTQQSQIDRDE